MSRQIALASLLLTGAASCKFDPPPAIIDAGDGAAVDAQEGDVDAPDAPPGSTDARMCNLRLTFQGGSEVWVANHDGTGLLNLSVSPSYDESPRWSPTGAKVVFVSYRTGNNEIFTVNADGTGLLNVTMNAADDQQPAFSPDGTKIAFIRASRLWVMEANGANSRELSTVAASRFDSVAWSPDGARLAFVSGGDIYTIPSAGGNPVNLTASASIETSQEWSPDGTKIAFVSATSGSAPADVWVMNADGSGPVNISQTSTALEASPQWSHDSLSIVFASRRDGNGEIYAGRISAPGQNQRLTNTAYDELMPAWAPNGTKLAFIYAPEGPDTTIGVVEASGAGLVSFALTSGGALRPLWAPCN